MYSITLLDHSWQRNLIYLLGSRACRRSIDAARVSSTNSKWIYRDLSGGLGDMLPVGSSSAANKRGKVRKSAVFRACARTNARPIDVNLGLVKG